MGAVLSFQGDRKVVIYSDNHIEPTPAFGSKLFTSHHGRSLFGHHKEPNSKTFKFGNGLIDNGNNQNHQHKHLPYNGASEPMTNGEATHYHHHNHGHHGLKKSLGFITGLHFGKHFGFHRDKKTKNNKKSETQVTGWKQVTKNESKQNFIKDEDICRNGIQKSLSCYNLKSGTTTNNIEIVKNIKKNLTEDSQEELNERSDLNHNHVVTNNNNINHNHNSIVNPLVKFNDVDVNKKDYYGIGPRKPILLTTEQIPVVRSPTQHSKPIIFLSKTSQLKPNVYSVLQQSYSNHNPVSGQNLPNGTSIGANCRKTSNVSISSSHSSQSGSLKENAPSQKRTVIQVRWSIIA